MKRGFLIGVLLIALGIGAGIAAFHLSQRHADSSNWLKKEFSPSASQMAKIKDIRAQYDEECRRMCERIAGSDLKLRALIVSSKEVTPGIREAIADTDAVRTACRLAMLEHFYKIADELPASQREKYLKVVLPVVLHPGEMEQRHSH